MVVKKKMKKGGKAPSVKARAPSVKAKAPSVKAKAPSVTIAKK